MAGGSPRSRNRKKGGSRVSRKRKKGSGLHTERGTLVDGLPDDFVLDVLASLPWSVQARCRCVCRAWNHALLHNRRPFPFLSGSGIPYLEPSFLHWWLLDPLSLHCKPLPQKNLGRINATAAGEDVVFVDFGKGDYHLFWLSLGTMQRRLLPCPHEKAGLGLLVSLAMVITNGYVYIAGGSGIMSRSVHRLKLEDHGKAPWVWERLSDMHEPRAFSTPVVLDGCVYLLGGMSESPGRCINSGEVFDPRTTEWTLQLELWPCDIFGDKNLVPPTAVVAGGRLYAVVQHTLEIMYYEPAAKVWKTLCSLSSLSLSWEPRILAVGNELWVCCDGKGEKVFRTTVGTTPQVPPLWETLPPIRLTRKPCNGMIEFHTNLVAHF